MKAEDQSAEREAFIAALKPLRPLWQFQDDGTGGFHNDVTELAWQAWQARAALSAREAPAREGWQLVPKEPTPQMVEAACCAADNGKFSGEYLRDILRAVLAASPQAPTTEGSET